MEGSKEDNKDTKVVSCNDSNMVKSIKLESFDINGSSNNCHSFSELLRSVLSRNSPCLALKAQHQMPQKTPEVLKPEVAEKQVELQRECSKPCVSLLSLTPAAVSRQSSAPVAASTIDIYTPQKIVETPAVDYYSWRKYGQKQVKNTNTYRSYYRCTSSDCLAKKKVRQCDQSGYVIDVVYVGNHNHEPPQRSCNRSRLLTSSGKNSVAKPAEVPLLQKVDHFQMDNANAQLSSQHLPRTKVLCTNSSTRNIGRVKAEEEHGEVLKSKQLCSTYGRSQKSSSCWIANTEVQEKHDTEQSPQKRKEDSNNSHLDSTLKAIKKHKTIVQDARISPDGFRWRKYGQKLVKGNSRTRSYYRCKLAGCPARKQVEKAIDDATAIAITYEGEHNHDVHVDDAYALVSSTTLVIDANYKNTETSTNQNPLTNWSAEMEVVPIVEKVLKNEVVKDNISGAKNFKIPLVQKGNCSDINSADVRQSSDHISGSEPQSSNVSDFNIRKVNVEERHAVTPESKKVSCSNGGGSQQSSFSWVANTEIQENIDFELEPSQKKRKGDSDNRLSDTVKASKNHNIVVQDAADITTSHNHCRWRKYGQKLVKRNSHTRSYYRCTSTGCPARKHVESAISDATATTVTFEGEHKHDMPVIRKQCVPDNPTTSMNNASYEKIESLSSPGSLGKRLKDREGELIGERVMELGGEKALESAQTLLSIKVEVRQ